MPGTIAAPDVLRRFQNCRLDRLLIAVAGGPSLCMDDKQRRDCLTADSLCEKDSCCCTESDWFDYFGGRGRIKGGQGTDILLGIRRPLLAGGPWSGETKWIRNQTDRRRVASTACSECHDDTLLVGE